MNRKSTFQAIMSLDPFSFKDFKSFETACNVKCLYIIRIDFVRTHITYSGNDYDIFNYTILDKNQNSVSLIINNWSIEDIYPGHYGRSIRHEGDTKITKWSVWNDYSISDPSGELRIKGFATPKEAIEKLKLFSKQNSWSELESSQD